jgi:hypothetical protein
MLSEIVQYPASFLFKDFLSFSDPIAIFFLVEFDDGDGFVQFTRIAVYNHPMSPEFDKFIRVIFRKSRWLSLSSRIREKVDYSPSGRRMVRQ